MLRSRLTNTIGVIVPELSEGYVTGVMLGVEEYLLQEGFLYFTVSHLGQPDLRDEYQELLMRRRVDGFLLVNTELSLNVPAPVVGISIHSKADGVTNVMLDHNVAARMALRHLHDLGHRSIAFMKGQRYSLDSEARWQAIVSIAQEIGLIIRSRTLHLPREKHLVAANSAILLCAICSPALVTSPPSSASTTPLLSAPSAPFEDAGLNCPRDISVIGFDDIIVAEYFNPRLTTVRQPLHNMGIAAAELLIKRIQAPDEPYPQDVWFEPELIVRESTAGISQSPRPGRRKANANRSALQPSLSEESQPLHNPAKPLRTLLPVFFYFVAAGIATVMLGPLLPALIQRWHIQDAQAGTLFTASFAGQFCGAWFATRNLRASVLYGSAITAAGMRSHGLGRL